MFQYLFAACAILRYVVDGAGSVIMALSGIIQPSAPRIMRALIFLLPVVFASCSNYTAPQREILKRAQAEIELREPWAGSAALFVSNPHDPARYRWNVRAGALDYSAYRPLYKGTYFVPGTERELKFTPDGCLTDYVYSGSACTAPITWDSSGIMLLGK